MNDLGRAFTFPFRDPDWVKKFLLGALITLLCIVVVGIFILVGYFVQVTQRVIRRDEKLLPDWEDIGVMLVVGFKYCVVYIIYSLPLIFLLIPMFVLSVLGMFSGSGTISMFSGFYTILMVLLMIPYGLALTLLQPIIFGRFAANESIADALDIAALLRTFRRNWQHTLIVALIATGIQSFASLGIILFVVGILASIFYSHLVTAYLYGALYLEHSQEEVRV